MISYTTERFRQAFRQLPDDVQRQARSAYRLFKQNPDHPSLNFKPVGPRAAAYSVRIGIGYRAVGVLDESTIIWFWIGSHKDYERLIADL